MARPFQSSHAKLKRAEYHRQSIEPEIKAFAESGPVALRSKHNLSSADTTLRFAYYVDRVERPPDSWSLVAGDAIQNIRAALDYAVWAVVVKEKGSEFAQANHSKIDFPIRDEHSRFPARRLGEIGLPARVIRVIEAVQPYVRQPTAPRDDALWLIGALSNVDKHRLLHLVALFVEESRIAPTPFLPGGDLQVLDTGPLHKGAKVVTFTAPRPPAPVDVSVQLDFRAGICIGATPETRAVAIDTGLRAMHERAIEVLDALAASIRPSKRANR